MATLINEELFEYLNHLKKELDRDIPENEESLRFKMRNQMREIINYEKKFLNYINFNKTPKMLSISPNGLPSVNSLIPDLEKMCELDEEEVFGDISKKYKKVFEEYPQKGIKYTAVSPEKWDKELKNINNRKLRTNLEFTINEAQDGKFEMRLREDVFLNGYDKYSQEFPIMTRNGNIKYHVIWNRLFEENEKNNYYLLKRKLKFNEEPESLGGFKGFSKGFAKTFFFFPTSLREIVEEKEDMKGSYALGNISGITFNGGVVLNIAAFMGLYSCNKTLGITALATHIITNGLSGIYELCRNNKKKLKNNALAY